MIQVPLLKEPNQSLSIVLGGNSYDLTIKETNGQMCLNLSRDGVEILNGHRVLSGQGLIPYKHQFAGYGQFIFDTPKDAIPYWENFTSDHLLYYFTEEELTA